MRGSLRYRGDSLGNHGKRAHERRLVPVTGLATAQSILTQPARRRLPRRHRPIDDIRPMTPRFTRPFTHVNGCYRPRQLRPRAVCQRLNAYLQPASSSVAEQACTPYCRTVNGTTTAMSSLARDCCSSPTIGKPAAPPGQRHRPHRKTSHDIDAVAAAQRDRCRTQSRQRRHLRPSMAPLVWERSPGRRQRPRRRQPTAEASRVGIEVALGQDAECRQTDRVSSNVMPPKALVEDDGGEEC
jgi:hypothetical protein